MSGGSFKWWNCDADVDEPQVSKAAQVLEKYETELVGLGVPLEQARLLLASFTFEMAASEL